MTRVLMLFLSVLFGTGPSQGAGWEWDEVRCGRDGLQEYALDRDASFREFVGLHHRFQEHFGLLDDIDEALDLNAVVGSSVFEVGRGEMALIGATYIHDGVMLTVAMIEHEGRQWAEFRGITTNPC